VAKSEYIRPASLTSGESVKDIVPKSKIPLSAARLRASGTKAPEKDKDALDMLEAFEKLNRKKKEVTAKSGKWIQSAIKKPGALKKAMGVKAGEKIPAKKLAKAAQAPGKMGQRARLAQTLRKMKK